MRPSTWYAAERGGIVRRFANDESVDSTAVALDMRSLLQTTSREDSQQWGITSIAFHPRFPTTPYLFVAYNTNVQAPTRIRAVVARFETADGGLTFDVNSEVVILSQPFDRPFHHLGQVAFGPDGYLYIGFGDGNESNGGQNLDDWLGAILRVDIDGALPYAIPPDNPLVGTGRGREELFAWGLRNPWRFSFDRETGDLWVGDVGGSRAEEVNLVQKGGNYGWNITEGDQCRRSGCDPAGLIPPVFFYPHTQDGGFAVIGGFVYRGRAIPALVGTYIFANFNMKELWGLVYGPDGKPLSEQVTIANGIFNPHAFFQDNDGELYSIRALSSKTPQKLVPVASMPPVETPFPTRLSETGCVSPDQPLEPASGLIPYGVNHASWADEAASVRWMALPDGSQLRLTDDGNIEFPVGSVLVQQFTVDASPVETRLLVRHDDGGWAGYSYEWLEDQSDAMLLPAGKAKQLPNGQIWSYPSRAQCMQCHTEIAGFTLGVGTSQLNRNFLYPSTGRQANQLSTLRDIGLFENDNAIPDDPGDLPALSMLDDQAQPVAQRARSYLHTNCSNCHRPGGPTPADIDVRFETADADMGVCNRPPQLGDLGLDSPALILPGSPERSMVLQRMQFHEAYRMPPIGPRMIDTAAVDVIASWIMSDDVCQ